MTPPPSITDEQRIASLEAEVVTLREALEETRRNVEKAALADWENSVGRLEASTAIAGAQIAARSALSSSTDYAGKVVVDREEWEAVNKVAEAVTGRNTQMSEGGYKDWQKNSSTFDIDQAINDLWVVRSRLDSLRAGGGE